LYNRVLSSIAQCQEGNRRIVDVGGQWASINNSVAGIPSAAGTRTIEKHPDGAIDAHRDALKTTARARELV